MIGLAMAKWGDDALRRVVDAPVEKWIAGQWSAGDGCGCLAHHVVGIDADMGMMDAALRIMEAIRPSSPSLSAVQHPLFGHYINAPRGYEACAARFGIPRVVRAIKQRALRILEQRDATLGEPTRKVEAVR